MDPLGPTPSVDAVVDVVDAVDAVDAVDVVDAIDVVVVSYNTAGHLDACLASLNAARGVGTIVVVDNGSHDGSCEVAARRGAIWIETGGNLGFGRAANRGIAATATSWVLLLNPDAVVVPDAIERLAIAAGAGAGGASKRVGVVGPRVENPDGTAYPSARAFPNMLDAIGHAFVGLVTKDNPWSRRYLDPARVEWISGTAMLLRRTATEAVGGFDEDYFMYVEDVDLCWRLRAAGWSVSYEPTAVVRHAIGASSEASPYRMIAAHHRSLLRFAGRTTRGWRRVLLPLVALGLVARTMAASARRLIRRRPPALH